MNLIIFYSSPVMISNIEKIETFNQYGSQLSSPPPSPSHCSMCLSPLKQNNEKKEEEVRKGYHAGDHQEKN